MYSAAGALGQTFDLVYTGVGALCWLPDIRRWAGVVASLLRPGGRLFIREGHPMLWALDESADRRAGGRVPVLRDARIHWSSTSRAPTSPPIASSPPTSPRVEPRPRPDHRRRPRRGPDALGIEEHDSVPWNPFSADIVRLGEGGEWRFIDQSTRIPLTYTLQAVAS